MPTPLFPIPTAPPLRRRSDRVSIDFPVEITGIDATGERFREETRTTTVSRFGCCVLLTHQLISDGELQLNRLDTNETRQVRVVGLMSELAQHTAYGLEITSPCDELWGIRFSSSDERQREASRDGIYFVDRDRKITHWSDGAEKLTGYKAGQTVGTHCYQNLLKHTDESGNPLCKCGCPLSRAMLDGEPREVTIFLRTSEGNCVPICVRAEPIRNSLGKVVGAIEVFSVKASEPPACETPLQKNPIPGLDLDSWAAAAAEPPIQSPEANLPPAANLPSGCSQDLH